MNSRLPRQPLFDIDRIIVGFSLVLASALAWWWLWQQPDMSTMAGMSGGALMKGMAAAPPPVGAVILMWILMMVAMMLPSALPMVLLHARLMSGAAKPRGWRLATTGIFALSYVVIWSCAAVLFALAQRLLVGHGLVSATRLAFSDPAVAGGLLIAAGLYQLTPLKQWCLESCRSPLFFLMRDWRPDRAGAIRLGLRHGLYCLGCCWALMALLFLGGVMNLAWVAILALIVLFEKVAPGGRLASFAIGGTAMTAGFLILLRMI